MPPPPIYATGWVLSPDLFDIYSEMIMRVIEHLDGINIGGRKITNVQCADDTALIADSESEL